MNQIRVSDSKMKLVSKLFEEVIADILSVLFPLLLDQLDIFFIILFDVYQLDYS